MNPYKLEAWLQLGIGLVSLIIINSLAQRYFFRIDLTEEKRYTITGASKTILSELKGEVYIDVYLEGDLPANFRRLQRSVQDMLDEFNAYADNQINYNFVDPGEARSNSSRNQFYQFLVEKGLQPINLQVKEQGVSQERLVFPGAIVNFRGKEAVANLLKRENTGNPEQAINQSVETLEYALISAIKSLITTNRKNIGYVVGHNELETQYLAGLEELLSSQYTLFNVNLAKETQLTKYDALMVCKPRERFSETEQFALDQYVMNGGNLLLFIEANRISEDSISLPNNIAVPYETGLEDLLFQYGIRINKNLVQDLQSATYPVVVGQSGNRPRTQDLPWPFFPLTTRYADHPIVRNLDATYFRYVSSLDTIQVKNIRRTPLVYSSPNARIVPSPVNVSLNVLRNLPPQSTFSNEPFPLVYLLEGKFTSIYKNRLLPKGLENFPFKATGKPAKILVCGDGNLLKSEINNKTQENYSLGFEPYSQQQYANGDFIVNAFNYLFNEEGIIQARKKKLSVRPLNQSEVVGKKVQWQVINILLPIILVSGFGGIKYALRKRKNESKRA
jgi:ABC-2 type transport system permease protein